VYWRRRVLVVIFVSLITVVGYLGISLGLALTNQSFGVSYSARFAEWGRTHGIGGAVTWLEAEFYKLHPAKVGGKPPASAFLGKGPTRVNVPASGHLPEPARMTSPAGPSLVGEGVWHVAGRTTTTGIPTVYEAFVRPDPVHTSYVVGVAWMDTTLLRAQLYSGSFIPGGHVHFAYSAPITANSSRTLVAAFNAGFRMQDAQGGYYTDGHVIDPLRVGAASIVIFKDGLITVGQWGRDVSASQLAKGNISSVRQNLDLIVDHAKPVAGLTAQNTFKWGKTLGGAYNVWRSGVGVTKNGALVYVGGPSLSIGALANVLVHAGAVRAMETDINTDWVQYTTFTGAPNAAVNGAAGTNLVHAMAGSPSRWFATWWSRDFFTMSLRSKSTTTTTAPG
jgi:hypothetical protein